MKRLISVAAVAGLLVLSACSSSGGKKAADQATKAITSGPRLKIAMVTHSAQGDAFWDIVQKGATAAAAKDNVQFLYAADPDGGRQAQLVQSYIDQHVDGLIVTLAKPDALKDVVTKAVQAKIPVITINSGADVSANLGALTHFGQDEEVAGEAAGRELTKAGVKNAVCLIHEQGNVGLEQRCAGAKKTFSGTMQNLFVQGANMPQVKAAVTGQGRAGKEQVAFMVRRLLNAPALAGPPDATDALALAICQLWRGAAADKVQRALAGAAR